MWYRRSVAKMRAAVLVLAIVGASPAQASQESELLYSSGLVRFHAGQYQDALQLFDEAVAADPSDPYALYYRGVTQARLKNYRAAVTDLSAAIGAKPDMNQAVLQLGEALMEGGQYASAIPPLQHAQAVSTLDGEASLFLGIAYLRLGQVNEARANLSRAAERDPTLELPCHYYQGLAEYQAGNGDLAQQHLEQVVSQTPDSEMGREAAAALGRIREVPAAVATRPFLLYGATGYQYDDNVQLLTDANVPSPSGRADSRFTLQAGAAYVPQALGRLRLALGYEFFQGLHVHLTDYNLQDNRLSAQMATEAGPAHFGLLAAYDFYLRDTNTYLSQGLWMPWASVEEGTLGRTEVFFRTRYRDYLDRPENGTEDATNFSPGVRQYVYLGARERYLFGGYRYDRNDPLRSAGNLFGFDGNEFSGGGGCLLPWSLQTDLAYAYHHMNYFSASGGRRDENHQVAFAIGKSLTDFLTLNLGYLGTFNHSNQALYRYDRNIGSVSLSVRY